jgi:hypothetical protein
MRTHSEGARALPQRTSFGFAVYAPGRNVTPTWVVPDESMSGEAEDVDGVGLPG